MDSSGEVFMDLESAMLNLVNTFRPRQHGRHFSDIYKCILLNIFIQENAFVYISIKIPPKFSPNDSINSITALVQIMTWRRSGHKPLSEPMAVSLLTHIWVTRPQWVNLQINGNFIITVASQQSHWVRNHGQEDGCNSLIKPATNET